jgi:hypothetical protein
MAVVRYEQVVTNPWVLFAKDGVNSWQRRDLFWRLRPGIEVFIFVNTIVCNSLSLRFVSQLLCVGLRCRQGEGVLDSAP